MSLLQYVKNIIYKAKGFDNVRIPQAYDSFGILMPEASSSVQGIRPFPLPEDEHLFALLFWKANITRRFWKQNIFFILVNFV